MIKPILALVLAASSMLSQAALFDGKSAQFRYYNGSLSNPVGSPAILEGGVAGAPGHSVNFQGVFKISLKGNNVVIDFLRDSRFNSNGSFSGFKISDVNNQFADFKSFSVLSNAGMTGLKDSMLTFDKDNLYVDWKGLNFQKSQSVVLGVSNVAPVPEPETYALMGLGLVGLLAARRRKALNVQN